MKLTVGKGSYLLSEDIGQVLLVKACDREGGHGGLQVLMQHVTLATIIASRQKKMAQGMPRLFTVNNNWLEIWPMPDKAYDCTVRYYPPAREL